MGSTFFFILYIFKKVFILLSHLVDSLPCYKMLGWKYFSFRILKVLHHCLLESRVAVEKSNDMLIYIPLHMVCIYIFFLESWRTFHLSRYSEISWQCLEWVFCHSCAGYLVDPDSVLGMFLYWFSANLLPLGWNSNHFIVLKLYGLGFQVGCIRDGWLISASQCTRPHLAGLRWLGC